MKITTWIIVVFNALFLPLGMTAQCTSAPVVAFPYDEDFETSAAWTTGGANNDWTWGNPNRSVINSASSGSKAWVTGGLTGTGYNDSEQSWIKSPCFDFTSLTHPWISFSIFWECEEQYDGMVLQYSLDNGSTWDNVGAFGDPVNCLNQHWYNHSSINWLTTANPKHGWSGRTGPDNGSCAGGQGSLGWVTASHCLDNLMGEQDVVFRFLFGSGTTCNNFDGVAIDLVHIGEAPDLTPVLTSTCLSSTQLQFQCTSSGCPGAVVYDFGDGSPTQTSVVGNTLNHTFLPGSYAVQATVSGLCYEPTVVTLNVDVLGVTGVITPPSCPGMSDGSVDVTVVPSGLVGLQTSWNSTPVQNTEDLVGVGAGSYTLALSGNGYCPVQATFVLSDNPLSPLTVVSQTDVSCPGADNGTVTLTTGLVDTDFNWTWIPAVSSGPSANNLAVGIYQVTAVNSGGCGTSGTVSIVLDAGFVFDLTLTPMAADCGIDNGTMVSQVNGGTANYNYSWTPFVGITGNVGALSPGWYHLTVTDANGCSVADSAEVLENPLPPLMLLSSTNVSCFGADDGTASLEIQGWSGAQMNACSWVWSPSNANQYQVQQLPPASYTVTAISAPGCSSSVSFVVSEPPVLTVDAYSNDTLIAPLSLATLQSQVSGGTGNYTYLWSEGAQDAGSIVVQPMTTTNYTVTVEDANGCQASDVITVTVSSVLDSTYTLYIPNTITPNFDTWNNGLVPVYSNLQFVEVRIFNRWGEEIFKGRPEEHEIWYGQDNTTQTYCQEGVYNYLFTALDLWGYEVKRRGFVTLLR